MKRDYGDRGMSSDERKETETNITPRKSVMQNRASLILAPVTMANRNLAKSVEREDNNAFSKIKNALPQRKVGD